MAYCFVFPSKVVIYKMTENFHVDRKTNKMKKLDPDSEFNKADKNGDDVISHQELEDKILSRLLVSKIDCL